MYFKEEIRAEFDQYRDMVQGNFIDRYRNLTLKAVLGLRWMSQYCSQAPFAIKTDDDTFLNIFEMVRLMTENANKSRVCFNRTTRTACKRGVRYSNSVCLSVCHSREI